MIRWLVPLPAWYNIGILYFLDHLYLLVIRETFFAEIDKEDIVINIRAGYYKLLAKEGFFAGVAKSEKTDGSSKCDQKGDDEPMISSVQYKTWKSAVLPIVFSGALLLGTHSKVAGLISTRMRKTAVVIGKSLLCETLIWIGLEAWYKEWSISKCIRRWKIRRSKASEVGF
jgi:hypothetical protein